MVNSIRICEPSKQFGTLCADASAPQNSTGSCGLPAHAMVVPRLRSIAVHVPGREETGGARGADGRFRRRSTCIQRRKPRSEGLPPRRRRLRLSRVCAGLVAVVPQSACQKVCRAVGASPAPAVLSAGARAANHSSARRLAAAGHFRRADDLSRQTEADEQKRARLAAALRENLKRRKAQARARRTAETEATDDTPPAQAETSRS